MAPPGTAVRRDGRPRHIAFGPLASQGTAVGGILHGFERNIQKRDTNKVCLYGGPKMYTLEDVVTRVVLLWRDRNKTLFALG